MANRIGVRFIEIRVSFIAFESYKTGPLLNFRVGPLITTHLVHLF